MAQFNFKAIGTTWQIDIYEEITEVKKGELLFLIKKRIEKFEKTYSRFRKDSLVTKMSKEIGTYSLPEDSEKLFEIYFDLYKRTNGFFTPLIGNLISDAGYDASYSLKQKGKLSIPPTWEDVIEYKNNNIEIKKSVLFDFGAAGKGYLIDLVGKVLEENLITKYCINAGGDILHKNNEIIKVGLENPENTEQVIGIYNLKNQSICGSAGNRRAWNEFTHIMNPKTLSSPKDILAVWVVADCALIADALTTCLFFVKAETLSIAYNFEYLLIRDDFSIEKSGDFSAELFAPN